VEIRASAALAVAVSLALQRRLAGGQGAIILCMSGLRGTVFGGARVCLITASIAWHDSVSDAAVVGRRHGRIAFGRGARCDLPVPAGAPAWIAGQAAPSRSHVADEYFAWLCVESDASSTPRACTTAVASSIAGCIRLQALITSKGARVIAGAPVARCGPFVMNKREEIVQAYNDYQSARVQQIARAD
jgi:hypothetical protein